MIIMLVALLGGLLLMNVFAKRSQAKRTAERETMLKESLVPGAWVQTFSGFFGRFVDTDGDVVILETPSGEETYWLKAAVKGVIDPPFEPEITDFQDDSEEEIVEEVVVEQDEDDTDK